MRTSTIAPALPEIDEGTATRLGDEILLEAASTEKVKKVKAGATNTVRAWSRGGSVD